MTKTTVSNPQKTNGSCGKITGLAKSELFPVNKA